MEFSWEILQIFGAAARASPRYVPEKGGLEKDETKKSEIEGKEENHASSACSNSQK